MIVSILTFSLSQLYPWRTTFSIIKIVFGVIKEKEFRLYFFCYIIAFIEEQQIFDLI